MTPFVGAVQLFELATEPKQFAPVVGVHGLSILSDPTYVLHINSFIDPLVD